MNITHTVNLNVRFPDGIPLSPWQFKALKDSIVSALSDKIAALSTAVDNATARVTGDVASLTQKIADLQASVDAGTATTADLQALDDLKTKLDKIDPATASTLPPA